MGKSEWTTILEYYQLIAIVRRNGFNIEKGDFDDIVKIVACRPPDCDDVTIFYASSFIAAIAFMRGYEQHKAELENNK